VHQDIVRELYGVYQENGYISEKRVFDALIGQNLTLDKIDAVCETLLKMGVIIRDNSVDDEETIYDRSQRDYELIYQEVISLDESMTPLINEIRDIKPPQHREWRNLISRSTAPR
jgi:RNA polymerase primary sigma factor